jgi:hypothetical protein
MLRRIRLLALVLVAAPALASPPASAADATAWDQAAVTQLASQLKDACIKLYDENYAEQGLGIAGGLAMAADPYRLQHTLQRLEEQSFGLADALKKGKGRDQTTPQVEDIGELADDAREILARMFVEHPLQKRIETARAIWVKLLPYYGLPAPPPPPPTER